MPARIIVVLIVLGFFATVSWAQSSMESVWRARELLGPGVWSRAITVENKARGGPYPRLVHALVFELAGSLWFYTDTDGTQSFSLHRGRLEQEKADFAPLLRDIERGFVSWTVLPEAPPPPDGGATRLRNGCFIESVAALRDLRARRARVMEPRLLSYYADGFAGLAGHTVLAYDIDGRVEIVDPVRTETRVLPRSMGKDPLRLARALAGTGIVKARFLPVEREFAEAELAVMPETVLQGRS